MQSKLERLYATVLLVIFGGIVLHAPLSVYLGTKFTNYTLLIKSWKEILLVLAGLLAIVIITKRHLWRELARDWLIRLIGAYAALHLLFSILFYQGSIATLAGLAIDLRFTVFFAFVHLLMRIAPIYRRRMLIVGAVGAVMVIGFGSMQLFLPKDILSHIGYSTETISPYLTIDRNPDYVRINSTLRGPNPLGAYVVIILSLVATFVATRTSYFTTPTRRWGLLLAVLCSGMVLWVSYSRSGFLALLVSLLVIGVVSYGRRLTTHHIVAATIAACVLVVGIIAMAQTSFVANVILHDNEQSTGVSSNAAHLSSVITELGEAVQQPFGTGIGSTGSAAVRAGIGKIVENQYLFEVREAGWFGLVFFVGIYGIIVQRLYAARRNWLCSGVFASGVGLAVIGLIQPVWVDDTVSIIWWGLAAVAIGGLYGRDQTNQKTA